MTEESKPKSVANSGKEMNWIDIIRKIWHGRKKIIMYMIVFFIIGIVYLFFTPKVYKSEITLVVETTSSSSGISGLLQQFGGFAGISSMDNNGQEAITPLLYKDVIHSTPFVLEILKEKVTESRYDSTITLNDYFGRHTRSNPLGSLLKYTVGLPGVIKEIFSSEEKSSDAKYTKILKDSSADTAFYPIKISEKQSELITAMSGCIETADDFLKTNKFTISVEMQDPKVVGQVTFLVVKNLTKYITEYRTKKAKMDLEFVSARAAEAEDNYIEKQLALAGYRDRNKNVILASVKSEESRLEAEYNLAFDLYTTLSQQKEQSKIKVQEETPIFNVVNPAQIPMEKSGPKTIKTLITMLFLGFVFGIIMIYGKIFWKRFKENVTGSSET